MTQNTRPFQTRLLFPHFFQLFCHMLTSSTMRFTVKVLPSRASNLGVIELNNPKALNSLSMDMIECLQDVFDTWMKDSTMKAILFKASKAKRPSFCAGGDVKAVWEMGMTEDPRTSQFFYQEYRVNHAIAVCPKPIISLWDGVVMGGGVGLSIHGKYRIATENTLFAMPETAIGLFPDVGSMYWMPRLLPMPTAKYLALTGQRITAPDLLYTGLATHYVSSKNLFELEKALIDSTKVATENDKEDVVADILTEFHEPIPTSECFLVKNRTSIEKHFDFSTCEEIFYSIGRQHGDMDEFASHTMKVLQKMSPTSMKVTLEALKRGSTLSTIGEDLQMEYRMARRSTFKGADFFEGVRSVLVDKDHSPKWNPATIHDVSMAHVEEFFTPRQDDDEWYIPDTPPTSSKL